MKTNRRQQGRKKQLRKLDLKNIPTTLIVTAVRRVPSLQCDSSALLLSSLSFYVDQAGEGGARGVLNATRFTMRRKQFRDMGGGEDAGRKCNRKPEVGRGLGGEAVMVSFGKAKVCRKTEADRLGFDEQTRGDIGRWANFFVKWAV